MQQGGRDAVAELASESCCAAALAAQEGILPPACVCPACLLLSMLPCACLSALLGAVAVHFYLTTEAQSVLQRLAAPCACAALTCRKPKLRPDCMILVFSRRMFLRLASMLQ